MVTPRNDSIELAVVKEKHPDPSAPPSEEYVNGTTFEQSSGSKRSKPRKRCWTVVSVVVVALVVIGAGTILFYEKLLGGLPAESNGHGPLPEATEVIHATSTVPSLVDRGPELIDPYTEEPSTSSPTTTDVIFIDSTTVDDGPEEQIFIDSKQESVENSSSEEDHERNGSGDGVIEPKDSSEETSYEDASGSGDGSGDGRE